MIDSIPIRLICKQMARWTRLSSVFVQTGNRTLETWYQETNAEMYSSVQSYNFQHIIVTLIYDFFKAPVLGVTKARISWCLLECKAKYGTYDKLQFWVDPL